LLKNLRILTLFPEMFSQFQKTSVIGKAITSERVDFSVHDLREFGIGKHNDVDDTPFGGGPGMVMKPEPFFNSVEHLKKKHRESPHILLTSPRGKVIDSNKIHELLNNETLYILCGRYEGVDQRVSDILADEDISIGNYVLSGGEIPAMVISDCLIRNIPGTLGSSESLTMETFSTNIQGKLKEPVYTKPRSYLGYEVPKILLSGDHKKIIEWRKKMRKSR
jgi:tRNA (guanine37-N1)-methyltransferase